MTDARVGRSTTGARPGVTFVVCAAVVLVGAAGCSSGDGMSSSGGSVTSRSASQGVSSRAGGSSGRTLEAEAFDKAAQAPGTVLLDVRTPQEYTQGHLPGARNIDIAAADFRQQLEGLDRKVPYAVYCRSANRSAQAMKIMKDQGFVDVYHLGGGVVGWQNSGRKLVTG
ncbi:Rhodanese-related sulfurtransferase [Austwickia chelonae]|uniref:Rhodanese domain-containing protein n=1 Tax=Austwickia chelonae NBRC 105200 TaxID=1184607 RepID=K6UNZ5_9MICO|nr:rhodanese-like domain-containing protein [Austwickia chelonae]GAB79381.1 hypothetical protein AUCHE_24_00360 [Austwickia chelonae NBRC 105200]SEW43699.1 Rhodanese-related sulfurtransferase [Austwickia chelonae]